MNVEAVRRSKGPLVWGDMDQRELDDAYDQRVWAANMDQLGARRKWLSQIARGRLAPPLRLAYGEKPIEGMDVYCTDRHDAPIAVFLHGGSWRAGAAADYAFAAEMFVNAGAHLAVVDFNNVDEMGGDLMPMAQQVRSAVAWLYRHARERFGGDAARICVIGHSSGAHLAGNVVTADWSAFDLPPTVVANGVLCSGIYDLAPVRLSKRSEFVNFNDAMENALSSQRHLDRLNCPLTVLYGTVESPEFQRQARDFAAAVTAAGKAVDLVRVEQHNHFEMAESLGNPYGAFGYAVRARMGLV